MSSDSDGMLWAVKITSTSCLPLSLARSALESLSGADSMSCVGELINITSHGPHPWVGDVDGDGRPDLLCCVEWSVYPFYSHAAFTMRERPKWELGSVQKC